MSSRTIHFLRRLAPCALAVAAATIPGRLAADDRGLLRFDTAKPYLFIIFDNSGSMASQPGDTFAAANGDDPTSKLYSAKQVAYNVFSSATDIQFAMATFNQDNLRVQGKHWLYTAAPGTSNAVKALPIAWPADGEQWVFGTFFPAGTQDVTSALKVTTAGTLGSPNAGLSLSTYMSALDRFPKLQINDDLGTHRSDPGDSSKNTIFYITASGKTYQYTVSRATGTPNLGAAAITVTVTTSLCTGSSCGGSTASASLTFNLVTAFLMNEGPASGFAANQDNETGVWSYSDVLQDFNGISNKQFSGLGIEGNYDGTYTNPPLPSTGVQTRTNELLAAGYDPYGAGPGCQPIVASGNSSAACTQSLKYPTTIASPIPGINMSTAVLDSGDLLPLNWNDTNQTAMLTRFAPNQAEDTPDFGQANYFLDIPDPVTGLVALKDPRAIPLLAAGPTPLGNSVIDFRCYYLPSNQGGSKCNHHGNFTTSWSDLASLADSSFNCHRTYVIVITDGNDTTGGPNPCADTANLKKFKIPVWVVAYGQPTGGKGGCVIKPPLQCMVNNTGGQGVCPQDPSQLQATLQSFLGTIREQAREFASAAVPSVQATVSDKIYLSDFTPANSESVWLGHVYSFLKPLPLLAGTGGTPDFQKTCSTLPANQQSGCRLWDAQEQVSLNQIPSAQPLLGDNANQRRIYYSTLTTVGSWAGSRQPLNTVTASTPQAIRYDLWRGFQIRFQPDNPNADPAAVTALNNVLDAGPCTITSPGPPCGVENTRQHQIVGLPPNNTPVPCPYGTTSACTYNLGDIFHSNPLIVGTPTNVKYFALNLNTNPNGTCASDPSVNTDPGYRCFEQRHSNRRKVLVVGSNDGMAHAFDAGQPHASSSSGTTTVSFDNGSGREVWAYMPRSVMPTVTDIANGTQQRWTVDGPLQGADVFIDPVQQGGQPDPSKREWRTILVGGLREGPEKGGINGYYALDVTQPDTLSVSNSVYVPQPVGGTALPAGGAPVPFSVPSCSGFNGGAPASCGRIPYPSPLWEFYDQAHNSDGTTVLDANGDPLLLDEDQNGTPDLGHTWSMPAIGRIQIADATGNVIDKYVAVFGGGLDANTKNLDAPAAGNWLYMVDMETGKTIYKRKLTGCAPSQAAAVDTDQTGRINRIYIGTTTGHMYRVDLLPNANGHLPKLQKANVLGMDGKTYVEQRITSDPDNSAVTAWAPREIFNANYNGSTLGTPRPIYYRPAVLFVAQLGLYGLAFGTGDREDLWSSAGPTPQADRYYLFVDDTDLLPPSSLPLNESAFTSIAESSPNTSADILEASPVGKRGWFLTLAVDPNSAGPVPFTERVITDTFALSGINVFTTFEPDITLNTSNTTCSKGGQSRVFVTFTTNANGVLPDSSGTGTIRDFTQKGFVTPPYTEQSQTKNPAPGTPAPPGTNADQLTQQLSSVMTALKSLFPRNCRFGNYRIDIKAIAGDTGVIFIAPVPICIVEKNWKEF